MKVAEGYFLRAEGALRGWSMGGSAKDLYEEGIRISIKNELAYKGSIAGVTSISDAEIDAYLNGTSGQIDFVDPVKAENSIKAMNTLGVKWDEVLVRRKSCNVSLLRNGSLTSHCLVRLGLIPSYRLS